MSGRGRGGLEEEEGKRKRRGREEKVEEEGKRIFMTF